MQSFDDIQKCQNAKNAKGFSACAGPCVRTSVLWYSYYSIQPICIPHRPYHLGHRLQLTATEQWQDDQQQSCRNVWILLYLSHRLDSLTYCNESSMRRLRAAFWDRTPWWLLVFSLLEWTGLSPPILNSHCLLNPWRHLQKYTLTHWYKIKPRACEAVGV